MSVFFFCFITALHPLSLSPFFTHHSRLIRLHSFAFFALVLSLSLYSIIPHTSHHSPRNSCVQCIFSVFFSPFGFLSVALLVDVSIQAKNTHKTRYMQPIIVSMQRSGMPKQRDNERNQRTIESYSERYKHTHTVRGTEKDGWRWRNDKRDIVRDREEEREKEKSERTKRTVKPRTPNASLKEPDFDEFL